MCIKSKYIFLFPFLLVLFSQCGGVIGSISNYYYNVPQDELTKAVKKVIKENKNIRIVHGDVYHEKISKNQDKTNALENDIKNYYNKFNYISIHNEKKCYIFRYQITSSTHGDSRIILTSAAHYGDGIKLAKNISFFRKRTYKKIFNDRFISKINTSVSNSLSNSELI